MLYNIYINSSYAVGAYARVDLCLFWALKKLSAYKELNLKKGKECITIPKSKGVLYCPYDLSLWVQRCNLLY